MGEYMEKGICGLYCFKNKQGEIIYIGKADDIYARLKNHKHLCTECYEELYTIEYTIINNKADRDILELLLVSKLQPKYNKQLKYTDKPTLVINSSIMLLWQNANPKEYNFIRQHENYLKHKTNSNIIGKPKIELPPKFYELYPIWKAGKMKATEVMRAIGMKPNTFYRRVKEYEATLGKEEK